MLVFLEDLKSHLLLKGCLAGNRLVLVGDFNCKTAAHWWNGQNGNADGNLDLESFLNDHG